MPINNIEEEETITGDSARMECLERFFSEDNHRSGEPSENQTQLWE
jgi:hypothetical protein